jgi:phosphopantetheinyl transferase
MRNQTDVPFSSFHIPQVSNLIKNDTERAKNKGSKVHRTNMYLTLILMLLSGTGSLSVVVKHIVYIDPVVVTCTFGCLLSN